MADLTLGVPRNGHFFGEFALADSAGAVIDLTGHTLIAAARELAGDGSVVAAATIVLVEPTAGRFSMRWTGDDFAAIGEPTRVARCDFDILHEYPDGLRTVPVRGVLEIIPESTPWP